MEDIKNIYDMVDFNKHTVERISKDVPSAYLRASDLYYSITQNIVSVNRKLMKEKNLIYDKYKKDLMNDYNQFEIERYYLLSDNISKYNMKLNTLNAKLKSLDELFKLLNNMSFLIGTINNINEKRGKL